MDWDRSLCHHCAQSCRRGSGCPGGILLCLVFAPWRVWEKRKGSKSGVECSAWKGQVHGVLVFRSGKARCRESSTSIPDLASSTAVRFHTFINRCTFTVKGSCNWDPGKLFCCVTSRHLLLRIVLWAMPAAFSQTCDRSSSASC